MTMEPFAYRRAADESEAFDAIAAEGASFIAGGTELLQLWKLGISAPSAVVDINALPLAGIAAKPDRLAIGALARLNDVAEHGTVRSELPALAEALLASASPQLRNAATIGGNLLQRTRCAYFRSSLPCNKREPRTGCAALAGENRHHAIFGASEHCAATHASDLAVALVALEARVRLRHARAERVLAVEELFPLPGDTPERDSTLEKGELLVEVEVPRRPAARRSHYLKVTDRASFAFALVSVAVALDIEGGRIRAARICAGGVGTRPWRLQACEAALAGASLDGTTFRRAAALAADGARPLAHNGFKAELLKRAVMRVLNHLGGAS